MPAIAAKRAAVYPRVCGGTQAGHGSAHLVGGLSPRVRGNPSSAVALFAKDRSIPACAGEPPSPFCAAIRIWVYPRVCGGTRIRRAMLAPPQGLSPRVRGNPARPGRAGAEARSIPACAGEPPPVAAPSTTARVYPRVCGGTYLPPHPIILCWGLSPRVRGNPTAGTLSPTPLRSIPACAGEPNAPVSSQNQPGVYPRVCGGTQ